MLKIDEYIWEVELYLMKRYGTMATARLIYPLAWYIRTGRASADFEKRLMTIKPYVIGRLLAKGDGMTHDEMVSLIKRKVNERRSA